MFDRAQLIQDLERDEGYRSLVYDDATGQPLDKGDTIKGNPTVGVGWALNKTPLSRPRAETILGWHIDDKAGDLYAQLPWLTGLTEARQRAMMNLAFNLGVAGLQKFTTFLGLMKGGRYAEAADDLANTPWHNQVGDRAKRIEALIKSG